MALSRLTFALAIWCRSILRNGWILTSVLVRSSRQLVSAAGTMFLGFFRACHRLATFRWNRR